MPAPALTPLLEGGAFFEAPRWHEGEWWISDFYRHAVYTVSTAGAEQVVLEVEHRPSGLGWLPDGSLLIVSMKDQRILRRDLDGQVSVHAELGSFTDSTRARRSSTTMSLTEGSATAIRSKPKQPTQPASPPRN